MDRAWQCGVYIIVTISVVSCDTAPPGVTATMTGDHETSVCNLAACSVKFDETAFREHLRGPKGDRGEKGEPGLPGLNGFCDCPPPHLDKPPTTVSLEDLRAICGEDEDCLRATEPTPIEVDTKNKALISCKHAPPGSTNGTYFLRAEDPFEVFCDMDRKLSCLIINNTVALKDSELTNYIKHDDKPFWISAKNYSDGGKFDLYKFYKYNMDQIEWLQKHSTFVTQKIRYHCYNSLVHPGNEKALLLLLWTDSVIGPQPTYRNPVHYTVTIDECKDSTTEWKHTDIVITDSPRRLPIIDFYIRDIRNKKDQRFYLEQKELCFG